MCFVDGFHVFLHDEHSNFTSNEEGLQALCKTVISVNVTVGANVLCTLFDFMNQIDLAISSSK